MKNLIAFIALTTMLTACGETKKEEKPVLKIGQTTQKTAAPKGTVLALTGNDMMQFDKKELTAKSGENYPHVSTCRSIRKTRHGA